MQNGEQTSERESRACGLRNASLTYGDACAVIFEQKFGKPFSQFENAVTCKY